MTTVIIAALLMLIGIAGTVLPAIPRAPLIFVGMLLAAAIVKLAVAFTMLGVFVAALLI